MSEIVSEGRRIVVGVDGSAGSKLALQWAQRLARTEQASIDIVAAWEYPNTLGWAAVPDGYTPKDDLEKAVSQVVDEAFGPERPSHLQIAIREGHPAKVLLDASAGALLLVVGSRGHGGFAGLLLGSVSARVAELATCPVLVVHGDQR
jgi:Universal stress protein UspA and related nucleotide-binding proteins